MTAARVDELRNARRIPQVALQKYNNLRSRNADVLICAFEGNQDVIFYDAAFSQVVQNIKYTSMVCKGKDQVLGLRSLLSKNLAAETDSVAYFVDRDYDDLKGQEPSSNLYCTPAYSIENFLVSQETLIKFLRCEYGCFDEDAEEDVNNICKLFEERMHEFMDAMRTPNRLLHYARSVGLSIGSVENDIKKYVRITLSKVESATLDCDLYKLIGFTAPPDVNSLAKYETEFDCLEPMFRWRGKFVYLFFKKFLAEVKEDRGRRPPTYFKQRAAISFDPAGEITRTIVATIQLPDCMVEFIKNIFQATLVLQRMSVLKKQNLKLCALQHPLQ